MKKRKYLALLLAAGMIVQTALSLSLIHIQMCIRDSCWNEFQFALTLTTGTEKRTLPIALYYFKSAFASDYGAMFAATVLVTVPSIIVYMLMQKQVISGLAAGSVKEQNSEECG